MMRGDAASAAPPSSTWRLADSLPDEDALTLTVKARGRTLAACFLLDAALPLAKACWARNIFTL